MQAEHGPVKVALSALRRVSRIIQVPLKECFFAGLVAIQEEVLLERPATMPRPRSQGPWESRSVALSNDDQGKDADVID